MRTQRFRYPLADHVHVTLSFVGRSPRTLQHNDCNVNVECKQTLVDNGMFMARLRRPLSQVIQQVHVAARLPAHDDHEEPRHRCANILWAHGADVPLSEHLQERLATLSDDLGAHHPANRIERGLPPLGKTIIKDSA